MKKEKDFEPGTIVRHKAGGPLMAVTSEIKDCKFGEVVCEWFIATGEIRTAKFETILLLKKM